MNLKQQQVLQKKPEIGRRYKMTPTNDPANDKYNPPGNLSQDFEKFKFGELELDELFWQTNIPGNNIPWRKVSHTRQKFESTNKS